MVHTTMTFLELGAFDLDPCAAIVNPTHICGNYYTEKDDGLSQPWHGRVFMNPPYSNAAPWIKRHAEHGNGISLVPSTTESVFWREIVWRHAKAILLLHGRVRFCRMDGTATTGNPLRPVCLIAWSKRDTGFLTRSTLASVLLLPGINAKTARAVSKSHVCEMHSQTLSNALLPFLVCDSCAALSHIFVDGTRFRSFVR